MAPVSAIRANRSGCVPVPADRHGRRPSRKMPPRPGGSGDGGSPSMSRRTAPPELVDVPGKRRRGTVNPMAPASGADRAGSIRLARCASDRYPRHLLPAGGADSSRHGETTHRLRMHAVRREHSSVARTVSRLRCVEFTGGSRAAHRRRAHAGVDGASGAAGGGVERGPRSGLQGRDRNVGARPGARRRARVRSRRARGG